MSTKTCNARGCPVEIDADKFMCMQHWFKLSRDLRRKISSTYRPGKPPSKAWLEAARAAIFSIPPVPAPDTSQPIVFSEGWELKPGTVFRHMTDGSLEVEDAS